MPDFPLTEHDIDAHPILPNEEPKRTSAHRSRSASLIIRGRGLRISDRLIALVLQMLRMHVDRAVVRGLEHVRSHPAERLNMLRMNLVALDIELLLVVQRFSRELLQR